MKKIFTLSALTLLAAVMLNSCVKNSHYNSFDEAYWLSKERGEVVYSDTYCSYYVVETHFGFTVIQSYGSKPYEGDILYGNFSSRGMRDIYNRSTGYVFSGSVTDYWLTYSEAQDALDYYCPLNKAKGEKRVFKTTTQNQ